MTEENKSCYKSRAKSIVDMLFDAKIFNEKLTRDEIQSVENIIAAEYTSMERCIKALNIFDEK